MKTISVPSKTFLLGEYLVLQGGAGLVALTEPRFSYTDSKTEANFPEGSPADKFLKSKQQTNVAGEFLDPHNGRGGFGASTAQYISALALTEPSLLKGQLKQDLQGEPLRKLWSEYQDLAWTGEGPKPSGVDFVAQLTGNICYYDTTSGEVASYAWPFTDKSFLVFRTGVKVKTHEHLSGLTKLKTSELEEIFNSGLEAIKQANWDDFCKSINAYGLELNHLGLTHPQSAKICNELSRSEFIKAVKPCGALGADTVLVCCDREKSDEVISLATSLDLELACSDSTLSEGISEQESTGLQ